MRINLTQASPPASNVQVQRHARPFGKLSEPLAWIAANRKRHLAKWKDIVR